MRMSRIAIASLATLALSISLVAQTKPAPVKTLRLYVFENGFIRGLDTKLFNLPREEVKEPDFVNSSYLIVHPRGTLQFDAGGIPDSQFKADGSPVTEGVMPDCISAMAASSMSRRVRAFTPRSVPGPATVLAVFC